MIARRSLLIVLNNVLGGLLGFFALRYIAGMPKDAYGYYAWAAAALGIAALFSSLGFPQAHIKRFNEQIPEGTANATFLWIKVALSGLFAILVAGGYWLYHVVFRRSFTDSTTEPIFYAVLIAYVLLSLRQFFDTVFQAHRHTARGESVLFVDTAVSVVGVVVAAQVYRRAAGSRVPAEGLIDGLLRAFHIHGPLGAPEAGLLLAGAYLLGRGVSLLYAAAQFALHRYPLKRPSRTVFESYRHFGIPVAVAAGLTVLYANIDRVFLGFFWHAENVANFQVPLQILTPMLLVSIAVGNLLFPTISRLQADGNFTEVRGQTRRAERYLTMILMPQAALAFVFAREGINLFNQRYVDQTTVLRILVFFVFLNVLVTPAKSLLLGTGKPHLLRRLALVNVGLVVILNLIAIPPQALGLAETGAALVAVTASLVTYGWVKYHAVPVLGPDFVPPGFWRQGAAALAMGALLRFLRSAVGPDHFTRFWQLGLVAAFGSLVYLALLALLREFNRDDWNFFWDLVHPGKLAGYVQDELTPKGKS